MAAFGVRVMVSMLTPFCVGLLCAMAETKSHGNQKVLDEEDDDELLLADELEDELLDEELELLLLDDDDCPKETLMSDVEIKRRKRETRENIERQGKRDVQR
jgi:hypothetical protein